jgi:hypothetical protein
VRQYNPQLFASLLRELTEAPVAGDRVRQRYYEMLRSTLALPATLFTRTLAAAKTVASEEAFVEYALAVYHTLWAEVVHTHLATLWRRIEEARGDEKQLVAVLKEYAETLEALNMLDPVLQAIAEGVASIAVPASRAPLQLSFSLIGRILRLVKRGSE